MNSKKTVITNHPPSLTEYLLSVKRYKHLIWVLAVRDFKVRYVQTYLGWLWAILQPVITVGIFSFVFTNIVQLDTQGIPYILVALSGMVFWNYFSSVVSNGSNAILSSAELIKKVSFPKICLIFSKVFTGFTELVISYCLLLIAVFYFGENALLLTFLLPFIILYTMIIGLGIAFWVSALSVRYRDLLQVVPYMLSVGMWLSPVYYTTQTPDGWFRFLNYINPMAGLIDFVRYAIFHTEPPSLYYLTGVIFSLLLLASGFLYLKKNEKDIVSVI